MLSPVVCCVSSVIVAPPSVEKTPVLFLAD